MNSVDPLDWLSQTLSRIAQRWPVTEIEALMPWNFKPNAIGRPLTSYSVEHAIDCQSKSGQSERTFRPREQDR